MEKDNMRLVSIVMGVDNKDNRSSDTISLMEYGFSTMHSKNILKKSDYKKQFIINNSSNRVVDYYLKDDVNIIAPKSRKDLEYEIETELFDVKAPLNKNSVIGKLTIKYDNGKYDYDLIVKTDIKKASYFEILTNTFKDIVTGNEFESL